MDRDTTSKQRYFQSKSQLDKNFRLAELHGEHREIRHFHSRICDPRKGFEFLCIEKLGVKNVLGEIVPDLDPSKRVNLVNSVLSKSPKFISLGLPAVDATDIHNIYFVSSTRANSLSSMRKDNISPSRLGYTHDFETMSETAAYRNHIKNSKFETREVFERETEIFH